MDLLRSSLYRWVLNPLAFYAAHLFTVFRIDNDTYTVDDDTYTIDRDVI